MYSGSHSRGVNGCKLSICILTILTTKAACTLNTLSALPPGYEDEILCNPSSACLRAVSRPHGWSGSQTNFVECCEPSTGETSRPRAWGERLDLTYKEELLAQGWAPVRQCTESEADLCGPNARGKINRKSEKSNTSMKTLGELESAVNRISYLAKVGCL